MKKMALLLAVSLALAIGVSAQGLAIGGTMENFSLPDTNGTMHTVESLKGTKGAAVIFLSAQCPVVKDYNQRISEIAAEYKAKGINFIGINSNVTESADWVKSHAAENYKFPVLIDKNNVLADKLGAAVTPEVYYVDAGRVLVYHGAIDNHRGGTNITEPYLRSAFDLFLAGQKLTRTTAKAFGCGIKRVAE